MAVTAPGVDYRQLGGKSTVPLQPRIINLHTMAGTLAGTESWFSGSGRAYSHFGVGGDGEIRQWQDLRYRAASDLNGNPYSISIECEDMGRHFPGWSGSNVPQFTEAQLSALVVLVAWLCARFGLPASAIRSSCTSERGVGWHRFGIDPWRNPSCPRWSSSAGKACPGDRRIAQIQNRLLPALGTPPTPPTPKDWLDMATEAQVEKIVDRVVSRKVPTLDQIALKVIETLDPKFAGNPVRVGDLNSHVQKQVSLILEAQLTRLRDELVEVLAEHQGP